MKVEGLKGSIYQRGGTWWVKYHQYGRVIRETTGSADQHVAEKLLLKRNAEIEGGHRIAPQVNRCKIDKLFDMVATDYRVNKRRSLPETERRIRKHLRPFFGGRPAISITTDVVTKYIERRQEQTYRGKPTSNGEINLELAILRRAFVLGRKAKKVDDAPEIVELDVNATRKGFFERAEFETVVSHLKPELAAVLRFGYVTGWRVRSEVLTLEWRHVDWARRTVRLEMGETKNDDAREFRFTSELEEVLRAQDTITRALQRKHGRICPWVFHRNGKPIRDYYTAWRLACLKAGLAQRDPKTKRIQTARIRTTSGGQRCVISSTQACRRKSR